MKNKNLLLFLLLIVLSVFTGCNAQNNKADSSKKTVYASFYPIYDMTKSIAGDKLNVISFMPEDKEAHYWEPSAKDIKNLNDAELFVINGASLENWIDNVKENAPEVKILTLSSGLNLISAQGPAKHGDFSYMAKMNLKKGTYTIDFGHTHESIMRIGFYKNNGENLKDIGAEVMSKEGTTVPQKETIKVEDKGAYNLKMGHEEGKIYFQVPEEGEWIIYSDRVSTEILSYVFLDENQKVIEPEVLEKKESSTSSFDPHSWISLRNAKVYIDKIATELSKIDPDNKEYFEKNRDEYIKKLDEMHKEYTEKFRNVKNRHFVVPHQAYAYLSRDYNIEQFPLQGLTSMEDPDLKTIGDAIDFCKEHNIKTVFYEYGGSDKGAVAIAKEIGGEVKPLSTMEFVAKEQKEKNQDYLDLMRMNLENIYESLK